MPHLETTRIEELRGSIQGQVLLPGSDAYDGARRIWNATIDKHPAVIVRCTTTEDVVRAVNFARENQLVLANENRV